MAPIWNWRDALRIGVAAARPAAEAPAITPATRKLTSSDYHRMGAALAGKRAPYLVNNVPVGQAPAFFQNVPEQPPLLLEEKWRILNLDRRALDTMASNDLIELLCDLSPDVSRALWDFLRMCNPGWEAVACRPGTDKKLASADVKLQAFLDVLRNRHGSFDMIINRLFVSAFLRGAFLAELVMDARGRTPLDIVTPDPASIRFRRKLDATYGVIWEMGQWQVRDFVAIDRPTVRYLAVDPLPGSPFGRPLATPALFSTLFLLNLLHDIKRVVSQQGYPRIDIEVDLAQLKEAMPANLEDDPEAFEGWVQGAIAQIENVYNNLEPDDAYVHTSVIKVNRPIGTVDANSLGAVQGLITALERMAVRALKTMPLMMGITDGVSEANANRQWEIYSAGIKALQHLGENLLEYLLTKAMQSVGIACTVQFRFAELRAAEELRDEQTRQLKILNIGGEYDRGWISQAEAAQKAVGHAPDTEEPRATLIARENQEAQFEMIKAQQAVANALAEQKLAIAAEKADNDAKDKAANFALKIATAEVAGAGGAALAGAVPLSSTLLDGEGGQDKGGGSSNAGGERPNGEDPANNTADVGVKGVPNG